MTPAEKGAARYAERETEELFEWDEYSKNGIKNVYMTAFLTGVKWAVKVLREYKLPHASCVDCEPNGGCLDFGKDEFVRVSDLEALIK